MVKRAPIARICVFFFITVMGVAADLTTKAWIFNRLGMPGEKPVWWVIPDVFGFQTSLNEGALFGMGQGMTRWFAALSVVFAVGIVVWFFRGGAGHSWWMTTSLAAITAGIFGNLYDRLGLHGLRWHEADGLHQVGDPVYAVRDWILVMIGRWPWPNFNIADSLLVCGVTALVVYTLFFSELACPSEEKVQVEEIK
ncbi:MAG TPA: signal peptidase II [Thermogutta sp.]|nr:signal peptidase II [Thermogutta sp.]HQF12918.1 signal peptidase II [Thermogutta sp.]